MPGDDEKFKVSFSELEGEKLFPIKSIEEREFVSNNTKKKSLKALLIDGELEIYSYLPKKVGGDIDDVLLKKINEAGATYDIKNMYNACFYGTNSTGAMMSFVGRVHEPGQPRSEVLNKQMTVLMQKYGKRQAEDEAEGPPSKK